MHSTPTELVGHLTEARANSDMDAIVACYEPDATIMFEPETKAAGVEAIRGFNTAMLELNILFSNRKIIEGEGIAIHYSSWTKLEIVGGALKTTTGVTTDILREQSDGTWLIAIDNPWGTEVLDEC